MKISIITLHRVCNFGSFLQAYALQTYLTHLGYEVEFVDYIPQQISNASYFWDYDKRQKKNFVEALFYNMAVFPKRFIRKQMFNHHVEKYLNLTKRKYHSFAEIQQDIPQADFYITGSDQVWNSEYNRGVDPAFFLAYAPAGKPRLAYAASFGRSELKHFELVPIQALLKKYKSLSVREHSALDILQKLGCNEGVHVLDPTFLLNYQQWQKFMSPRKRKEKYLLIYQLNNNPFMIKMAAKIAKKKNLKVVKISLNTRKPAGVDYAFNNIPPARFLSLISFAEFVVTDSFHGVAFSINFKKELAVIPPDRYATRLISLIEVMGISDRLMTREDQLEKILQPVAMPKLIKNLEAEREKSYAFLQSALN